MSTDAKKIINLQDLKRYDELLQRKFGQSLDSVDSVAVHKFGNETIDGEKTFSSTISGSIDGNAATATKLATARTITLGTDLTGSVSFDGSGDVTLNASVNDDSHNHVISNVDGLQSALDAKAADSDVVHIAGTETVTGAKTFTSAAAISMSQPVEVMSISGATKTINPSSNCYGNINFQDKTTTVNWGKRAGSLDCSIDTNGQTGCSIRAFDWSQENNANGAISIYYPRNGTPYTYAPTPSSTTDDSGKIATTEWVRDATGNFACNAATAAKLASARTLSLYGDAEGSTTFDGSANAGILVSIDEATSLAKGLMSASDKDKLDSLGAVFSFKGTVSASSSLPASGSNGDAYYVSGEDAVYAYDGTNWVDLLSGVFTPITNAEVDAVFA